MTMYKVQQINIIEKNFIEFVVTSSCVEMQFYYFQNVIENCSCIFAKASTILHSFKVKKKLS